jgi:TRAP-type mannitol/chloroaromatic compound transport system permease large subunit
LGISVVLVGALLAASTGIVGATVVAMGLIALPTMLRNGYSRAFLAGIVCTAGTLGQIIPPSTLLIILADVMSNSFQQAQFAQGKFSIETISVGQVFAAAFVPGSDAGGASISSTCCFARSCRRKAPAMRELENPAGETDADRAIVPPVLLIVAVLGSILGGVATPSEAASVGAVGAIADGRLGWGCAALDHRAGAAALVLLAVIAGTIPVRLQRRTPASPSGPWRALCGWRWGGWRR